MNSKISALFTSLVVLFGQAVLAADDAPKILPAKPGNGVFVTSTGRMKTVIELKDGKFRYWFESDAKLLPEPTYPLEGAYSVEGSVVKLDHPEVFQKEWTCRSVDGVATLWRPDALKIEAAGTSFLSFIATDLEKFKVRGAGAILVATKLPAEKAWTDEAGSPASPHVDGPSPAEPKEQK